jgi:hypothetical protein
MDSPLTSRVGGVNDVEVGGDAMGNTHGKAGFKASSRFWGLPLVR